jgi:hypothetical protein
MILPRHVKVSLFIQEKIQSLDGTLNIFYTGTGPIYSQKPGTVTYYDKDGSIRDTDEIKLKSAENYEKNDYKRRLEGATDVNLGLNMYAENRQALCTRPKPQEDEDDIDQRQKPTIKKPPKEESKESKDHTQQEYNFLAKMVRNDNQPQEKIKITFPGLVKALVAGGSKGTVEVDTVNIDVGDSNLKKKKTMLDDFDDMDITEDKDEDEDDLLDLMDN